MFENGLLTQLPEHVQEAYRGLEGAIENSRYPTLSDALKNKIGLANEEELQLLPLNSETPNLTDAEKVLLNIPQCRVVKLNNGMYMTSQTNKRGATLSYLVKGDTLHNGIGVLTTVLFSRFSIESAFVEVDGQDVVDLKSIYPPDRELILETNGYMNRNELKKVTLLPLIGEEGDVNFKLNKNRGDTQIEMLLHEAGHAWLDYLDLSPNHLTDNVNLFLPDLVKGMFHRSYRKLSFLFDNDYYRSWLAKLGKNERLPSAIALLIHRKYSQNGIELTPGLTDLKELFGIFEKDLLEYEDRRYDMIPHEGKRGFASSWYKKEMK
jgi:hypothetical protein